MGRTQLVTLCLLVIALVNALDEPGAGTEPAAAPDEQSPSDAPPGSETVVRRETESASEAESAGGHQTEMFTEQATNSTTAAVTQLIDLMTYKPSGEVENGGDPFVSPDGHKHGIRHVRAHDGFHNIKNEPLWAHWNDPFTTTSNIEPEGL